MYRCITRKSPVAYMLTSRRLYILTGFTALYATIVAAVPLFRNGYGIDGSQCFLVTQHTHLEYTMLITLIFYGPLWICISYCLFSYITIFKYVKRINSVTDAHDSRSSASTSVRSSRMTSSDGSRNRSFSTSQQTENVVWKLIYYPGMFVHSVYIIFYSITNISSVTHTLTDSLTHPCNLFL